MHVGFWVGPSKVTGAVRQISQELARKVDILQPNSRPGRGLLHCRHRGSTWMHLANGEGRCPPLCGPNTEL